MYPQFMRPLVPGRGSTELSSVMDSYLLMVNYMQRQGVVSVKNDILTFKVEESNSALNKKEKNLIEFFNQNYPFIPMVPSGSAREAFLRKYQEKVLQLWPMLTDTQQVHPDAKAFMENHLPVVFSPPTVNDKNVSSELRQLLEYSKNKPYVDFESFSKSFKKLNAVLNKKPLNRYGYSVGKFDEDVYSLGIYSYPERKVKSIISKNSAYVKELKQTPWNAIKNRYNSFKFWGISAAYVAVPATVVALPMPEVAIPVGFFGLFGAIAHGMIYGLNFNKSRYLKLTDEGQTLLKQLEAWENFKDNDVTHGSSQYDFVNLQNVKPLPSPQKSQYTFEGMSDYEFYKYRQGIREIQILQQLLAKQNRKKQKNYNDFNY